ncbi:MAG: sterol desaturase family protein [Proteobacteria bacterium]|jgi:sterol desaturase/sphingolipid hydroxylase (fatty acid hydroxylase superfamily)|nr:sterol desaturase family protein [Pseudomonadota bacterium]
MYEIIELATLGLIPAFLVLDLVWRKRRYATTRFWRLRALLVSTGIVAWSIVLATGWGLLLGDFHLLDGNGLGIVGGTAVGILAYEFLHYWYHRLAHRFDFLWRFHQMHHSAESLDAFGANYIHPLDAAFFTTWSSLVFYPLLGLPLEAGILGALFITFNAMFQHANIKTPHWLGYLIERPESHAIHHGRGLHRYNYSDLPLWDILFGTFRNPRSEDEVPAEAGFYKGASSRLLTMLLGRDVTRPVVSDVQALPQPDVEVPVDYEVIVYDQRQVEGV